MQSYSQTRAMLAITKASLRSLFRSVSAVIFSFVFPFIFIIVFGFIGGSGRSPVYKIAIAGGSDTSNAFYDSIRASKQLMVIWFTDTSELRSELVKNNFAAIVSIQKANATNPAYVYSINTTTANSNQSPQLIPLLASINNTVSNQYFNNRPAYAALKAVNVEQVRKSSSIDFILPGQLGFSLLSTGVFGVAFVFFNLRNTLVLKRFFATPISRTYIVLGEALARVLFQMLTALIIIIAGRFIFGFTLIDGVFTVFDMLLLSFIGLVVFMGFGFVVSGLAKSESTIPPFANMITLPQFLLGGTFFPIENFPKWLQPVSKALPLTHLNTALRAVAFEGQSLWQVKTEIGILLLWGIFVYALAIKVFKWE